MPPALHAGAVRQRCGLGPAAPFDVEFFIKAQGWRVVDRELMGVGGSVRQAALLPSRSSTFVMSVDPRWSVPETWEAVLFSPKRGTAAIRRARLAHELGHTFFYRWPLQGEPPRRAVPGTPAEEVFCDAFATELLAPKGAVENASGAKSAVAIAHSLCVPVSLVLTSMGGAAAGGVVSRGSAGELAMVGRPVTWDLPDTWLLWDEVPGLWPELERVTPLGGNCAFLALVSSSNRLSMVTRVVPQAAKRPAGYALAHADMGTDQGNEGRAPLGPPCVAAGA